MDMNLKAFMKKELKDRGNMEFPGTKSFVDAKGEPIPFIVKRLSRKEIKEIGNRHRTSTVYKNKKTGMPVIDNGKVVMQETYDAEMAGLDIMVEAFVQPKLDDPELMEFYGVLDRLDMPDIIFAEKSDFKYANECVRIACGLMKKADDTELVEEVKN